MGFTKGFIAGSLATIGALVTIAGIRIWMDEHPENFDSTDEKKDTTDTDAEQETKTE